MVATASAALVVGTSCVGQYAKLLNKSALGASTMLETHAAMVMAMMG